MVFVNGLSVAVYLGLAVNVHLSRKRKKNCLGLKIQCGITVDYTLDVISGNGNRIGVSTICILPSR